MSNVFAREAARWVDTCIYSSPWLSILSSTYTLVDYVSVRFRGMCDKEISDFIHEWHTLNPNSATKMSKKCWRIKTNRDEYMRFSSLDFKWQPLELYIIRLSESFAYAFFIDNKHRMSKRYFLQENNETCSHKSTHTSSCIPWLLCEDSL
jgi:hypothetical protein